MSFRRTKGQIRADKEFALERMAELIKNNDEAMKELTGETDEEYNNRLKAGDK